MSKNLTRKGLAFGAVLALGSTLITGTAASAVDAVSLEAAEGTTYNVPLASGFTLKALFTDAAQQGAEALNFRITDTSNKLDITDDSTSAADSSGYVGTSYSTANNVGATDEVNQADSNSDGVYFVSGSTSVAPTASYLYLLPKSTVTTSFSVTVQAFMDLDGDNVIDSGEAASVERSVQFVATADITGTSVVDSYGLGDSKITASVKTTPVLNGALLANDSNVVSGAIVGKVTNAVSTNVYNSTATKWDETNQEWDVTTTLPSATVASTTVSAGVSYTHTVTAGHGLLVGDTVKLAALDAAANITGAVSAIENASPSTTFTVPNASAATVVDGAGTVQVVVGSGTYTFKPYFSSTAIGDGISGSTGAAVAASASTTSTNTADQKFTVPSAGNTTIVARTGKTVTATYTVKDADKAVVAGKQVRITASSITGTLKINGATTAVANNDVINAVTNASGQVSVSIATTSAANTDAITLTFVAEAVSATSKTVIVGWDDAVYYIVDTADTAAIDNNTANRAAAKGASVNFNLSVVDQWRQAIDGAKYRLKVAATTRTVWTKFVSISGGKASFSVEDGALTSGTTGVAISFQKLASGTWADIEGASADAEGYDWGNSEDSAVTITYYDQTDAVSVTAPTAQTRTADATVAVDGRTSGAAAFSTTSTAVTIAGDVKNAVTGALKVGAVVTVSGSSDILFQVGGVSAFGSITFVSADGNYSVSAFSNKVLSNSVVTITSGAASKTAKVSFNASTTRTDITQVVATGAVSKKAGRTSVLTFATADEFGNAVKVSGGTPVTVVNYGPGYLTAYPSAFGNDGTITVVLITGSTDAGYADIKVVADGATVATTDDLTVHTTGLVNVSASVSAGSKKANVVVKNAEGLSVKVVSGAKTVTKVATSDSFKVSLTKLTAGKKTVKVYVNDVLVSSKSVTVKK